MAKVMKFKSSLMMAALMALVIFVAGCGGGGNSLSTSNAGTGVTFTDRVTTGGVTGTIEAVTVDAAVLGREAGSGRAAAATVSDFTGFTVKPYDIKGTTQLKDADGNAISGTITGNKYTINGLNCAEGCSNIMIKIVKGKVDLRAFVASVTPGETSTKAVTLKSTAAALVWISMGNPSTVSVANLEDDANVTTVATALATALADPTTATSLTGTNTVCNLTAVTSKVTTSTTALNVDTIAPTIMAVSPNSLVLDAALNTNIVLTFNEAMGSATSGIVTSVKYIQAASSTPTTSATTVTVTWSTTRTLTINPGFALTKGKPYTVDVALDPTKIKDTAGNALSMPAALTGATLPSNAVRIKFTTLDTAAATGKTFVGAKQCVSCHSSISSYYGATKHSSALATRVTENEAGTGHFGVSCLGCHTTDGMTTPFWTSPSGDTSTALATDKTRVGVLRYATASAFIADYPLSTVATAKTYTLTTGMTVNAFLASVRDSQNGGIQCESCHGPGSDHINTRSKNDILNGQRVYNAEKTCHVCHDSPRVNTTVTPNTATSHLNPWAWRKSLHATTTREEESASCSPCHTTEGFVDYAYRKNANSAAFADDKLGTVSVGFATATFTGPWTHINCVACHDPHPKRKGEAQLRVSGTDICLECHMGRKINRTSAHANSQGFVRNGIFGVDKATGKTYWSTTIAGAVPRTSATAPTYTDGTAATTTTPFANTDAQMLSYVMGSTSCVDCHMGSTMNHDMNLRAITADGAGADASLSKCAACHPSLTTAQARTEITNAQIASTFVLLADGVTTSYSTTRSATGNRYARLQQRVTDAGTQSTEPNKTKLANARLNLSLANADKSFGFHNPGYVKKLLDDADAWLTEIGF